MLPSLNTRSQLEALPTVNRSASMRRVLPTSGPRSTTSRPAWSFLFWTDTSESSATRDVNGPTIECSSESDRPSPRSDDASPSPRFACSESASTWRRAQILANPGASCVCAGRSMSSSCRNAWPATVAPVMTSFVGPVPPNRPSNRTGSPLKSSGIAAGCTSVCSAPSHQIAMSVRTGPAS